MDELARMRLRVPEIRKRIDATLSRDQKTREVADTLDPTFVDRMSASGRCYRERWFKGRGYPMDEGRGFSTNPRLLRILRLGHVIEEEIVLLLEEAGFVIKDRQLEVGSGDWVGHIDGLIDMGARNALPDWCLLEIKTANNARFDALTDLDSYEAWSPQYAAQLHAYMHHINDCTDAIVVVYNKDTSAIYTERILYDLEAALLLEQENRLATAEGTTPPPRPKDAKTQYGYHCKWCDFQQTCWSGAVDVEFDD